MFKTTELNFIVDSMLFPPPPTDILVDLKTNHIDFWENIVYVFLFTEDLYGVDDAVSNWTIETPPEKDLHGRVSEFYLNIKPGLIRSLFFVKYKFDAGEFEEVTLGELGETYKITISKREDESLRTHHGHLCSGI